MLERLDRRPEATQAFQAFIARWKGDPSRARGRGQSAPLGRQRRPLLIEFDPLGSNY